MAAPVITSIVLNPDTIPPGGTTVVTINAFDPDSTSATLAGTATDVAGNLTAKQVVLKISDPLTYALAEVGGTGLTIVQRPAPQDNVFDVTAS